MALCLVIYSRYQKKSIALQFDESFAHADQKNRGSAVGILKSYTYIQSRRKLFKSRGACSNRLSLSLSVLFSELPSGGAPAPPATPLSTALIPVQCMAYAICERM